MFSLAKNKVNISILKKIYKIKKMKYLYIKKDNINSEDVDCKANERSLVLN